MNKSNKEHLRYMNSFILKDIAKRSGNLKFLTCSIGLPAMMEIFIICDVLSGNQWPHVAIENVEFG